MGYLFDCSLTGLDNNHSKQDVFFGSALIWQARFYLHVIFVVDGQIREILYKGKDQIALKQLWRPEGDQREDSLEICNTLFSL